MSDEEKKAIEWLKKADWFSARLYSPTILNLIEKQQKEIERLEARKYMLNAETGEISQIPIDNNYISKDKIKAKIEEVHYKMIAHQDVREAVKEVLQSLLEKE